MFCSGVPDPNSSDGSAFSDLAIPTLSPPQRSASDLLKSSWRFLFASAFSFCLTFATTLVAREIWGQSEQFAFGFAITVALVVNFLFLRFFIYGRSVAPLLPQIGIYLLSAPVFRLGEFLLFEGCLLLKLDYRLSTVLVLGLGSSLKFLYYRLVFKR